MITDVLSKLFFFFQMFILSLREISLYECALASFTPCTKVKAVDNEITMASLCRFDNELTLYDTSYVQLE